MDDVIIGNESIFSFSGNLNCISYLKCLINVLLVASLLADYGWYLLIGVIICLYIYKQLQPNIQQYWNKKADQEYAEKYHKGLRQLVLVIALIHIINCRSRYCNCKGYSSRSSCFKVAREICKRCRRPPEKDGGSKIVKIK